MDRNTPAFLAKSLAGALVLATVAVLAGRAFYQVTIAHEAPTVFHASALWGVLVLAGFAGWGTALSYALFPRERTDWGLRCAWGWAIAVAVGGLLCALGLAVAAVLRAFVEVGLLLFFAGLVRDYMVWRRTPIRHWARAIRLDAPFLVGLGAIFVLGAALYLGSIVDHAFNGNDDDICYFGFAREILQRGTLTQPFSLRRMSSYGGKSLLDAIQLAIDVPDEHLHLIDNGMGALTVMALLVGHVRSSRWTSRALVLLAGLLVVCLPNTRINSATHMVGAVFFLGLYRTLSWRGVMQRQGLRPAIPVALLAAGACTLRQSFLPPIGALLAIAYGAELVRSSSLRPLRVGRSALVDAGATAGMLVVFLLPWWFMSERWVGTFLFPITRGNFNPAYSFFEQLKTSPQLHYLWANICYCLPVKAVPLFLAAALTLRDRAPRKPLVALCVAAFIGFLMLIHSYPEADAPNLGRYYFGFTFAGLLAIVLATADLASRLGRRAHHHRELTAVPLVIVALALQLYEERGGTFKLFDDVLNQLEVFNKDEPWVPSHQDRAYQTLQDAVPAGAPIASLVDSLSHFDHARNRIASLDMVGAVAPDGPLPLAAGGEALAAYLVAHGYRYVVFVHPTTAHGLYRRDVWERNQRDSLDVWKWTAHFYLEMFNAIDQLLASRVHLADAAGMTTLDLATKSP